MAGWLAIRRVLHLEAEVLTHVATHTLMQYMTVKAAVSAVEVSPTYSPPGVLVTLRSSSHGWPWAAPEPRRYGDGSPAGRSLVTPSVMFSASATEASPSWIRVGRFLASWLIANPPVASSFSLNWPYSRTPSACTAPNVPAALSARAVSSSHDAAMRASRALAVTERSSRWQLTAVYSGGLKSRPAQGQRRPDRSRITQHIALERAYVVLRVEQREVGALDPRSVDSGPWTFRVSGSAALIASRSTLKAPAGR
jgi:hypothetical protein